MAASTSYTESLRKADRLRLAVSTPNSSRATPPDLQASKSHRGPLPYLATAVAFADRAGHRARGRESISRAEAIIAPRPRRRTKRTGRDFERFAQRLFRWPPGKLRATCGTILVIALVAANRLMGQAIDKGTSDRKARICNEEQPKRGEAKAQERHRNNRAMKTAHLRVLF